MTVLLDGGGSLGIPVIPSFVAPEDWMAGTVTSYNPTTGVLVANVLTVEGTDTYDAWNIYRAPTPGTSMILVGTSVTSCTIGTGAKTITMTVGSDLAAGELIYIVYASQVGMNKTGMILTIASDQLADQTGQTWNIAVLVPYLNLFLLEVMNLKPDAYATTQNITLVQGPVQSLPASAIALVDVVCNMGVSGTTRGTPIQGILKDALDDLVPDWMTWAGNAEVKFVATDPRNPKKFWVFPPQPASPAKIECVLTIAPTPITSSDGTFPFDDSYIPPAVDYVVGRALSEETSIPNSMAKATLFLNKFMQGLGLKTNQEKQDTDKGK
jgi:hypothetical protein